MQDIFLNKFKERLPAETVEIVQNFFHSLGLEDRVITCQESEIGTWWCHIELYQNNTLICSSNGKGITIEYNLASGYAELYERFCNKIYIYANPFTSQAYMVLSQAQKGYLFDPNEIEISYEDLLEYPFIKHFFTNYLSTNDNITEFFNLITNNHPLGIPFTNFNDKDKPIWIDPRVVHVTNRTKGLVAGNTLEEALNQGISEVFECYVRDLYFSKKFDKYYILNEETLNETNQQFLNNIRQKGYEIFLLDFSYLTNMPVIAAVLINPETSNAITNLGCFPILDIAVERCLTELYQGISSYHQAVDAHPVCPSRNKDFFRYGKRYLNSTTEANWIFEEIFLNNEKVYYNTKVFLDNKDYTNQELNQYYKKLCEDLNYHIYYYDNSLSSDMYALRIICTEIPQQQYEIYKFTSELLKEDYITQLKLIYSIPMYALQNRDEDVLNSFHELRNWINNTTYYDGYFVGNLTCADWLNPFPWQNQSQLFYGIANALNITTPRGVDYNEFFAIHPVFKYNFFKYMNLKFYNMLNRYTKEEIKQIFKTLSQSEITDEDLNNIKDELYFFKKVYCEPFREYYLSENFAQILNLYMR